MELQLISQCVTRQGKKTVAWISQGDSNRSLEKTVAAHEMESHIHLHPFKTHYGCDNYKRPPRIAAAERHRQEYGLRNTPSKMCCVGRVKKDLPTPFPLSRHRDATRTLGRELVRFRYSVRPGQKCAVAPLQV